MAKKGQPEVSDRIRKVGVGRGGSRDKRVRMGGEERWRREYPQLELDYLRYEVLSPSLISTAFFCPSLTFSGSVKQAYLAI